MIKKEQHEKNSDYYRSITSSGFGLLWLWFEKEQ